MGQISIGRENRIYSMGGLVGGQWWEGGQKRGQLKLRRYNLKL